jgi:hypothetical protein
VPSRTVRSYARTVQCHAGKAPLMRLESRTVRPRATNHPRAPQRALLGGTPLVIGVAQIGANKLNRMTI